MKKSYVICNITDKDYCDWCKSMRLNKRHLDVKKNFYWRILTGRLVRNSSTGKLEKHRVMKGMNIEW